jgi:hypothetical protein
MRTLVDERAFTVTVADGVTYTFDTPIVRPLFQGYAGLDAQAREAIAVDKARFVWSFRSVDNLPGFEGNLVLTRFPRNGGWGGVDFLGEYPATRIDVSGALLIDRGVISYNATFDGVLKGAMEMTNRSGGTLNLAVQVQVFGWPMVPGAGENENAY